MSYLSKVYALALENTDFRRVLYTGAKSQLVIMSIPPGGEIGEETHEHVEQTLFILTGSCKAVLDGEESVCEGGDVVVVSPGVKHNILNTGSEDLKICTVYAPANHIDGRVHATKADADADAEDEAFGEQVR